MNFGGNDNGTTPTREGKNGKNISFFLNKKKQKGSFLMGKKEFYQTKWIFTCFGIKMQNFKLKFNSF